MSTGQTIYEIVVANAKAAKQPITPSCGLVAFFDVLGFKSLLENNKVGQAISIIREVLVGVPKELELTLKPLGIVNPAFVPKHLVFSDSILIYAPVETSEPLVTCFFVSFCREILARLFDNGLPLRGAIAVGEYYVEDYCFAGKPIVEAHELGDLLQLSGCALAANARKHILGDKESAEIFFEYPAPLKGGEKEDLFMLNFRPSFSREALADTRSFVEHQFSAHKKPKGDGVDEKIHNTVAFLEECRRRNPSCRRAAEDETD